VYLGDPEAMFRDLQFLIGFSVYFAESPNRPASKAMPAEP
jgi:hypothetical protein